MSRALEGKIALVTGASRGLGAAVAERYAAEGAHPILLARTTGGLEATDDRVRAQGGQATIVAHDLTDLAGIDRLGETIFERFGRLDILVGAAGFLGALGPLAHGDPKAWDRVIATNLTANWRLLRTLDPLLRAAPAGRALFATASEAEDRRAYWGAYAVAKAGLEAMVGIYAAENVGTRVRANLIDPGPMATRLRRDAYPGEDADLLPTPESRTEPFVRLATEEATENGGRFAGPALAV